MKSGDTICAPVTPSGTGAIAVFRISGPDAIPIASKLLVKREIRPRERLVVGSIHLGDDLIDQVVMGIFRQPASYTGEDIVEISTHGSIFIQRKMMQCLSDLGCRPADGGEFTMRAFLNGKMDLSQAEAVADIITSESEASHRMSQQQLQGAYSSQLKTMRQNLVDLAALVELELDFGEEDVTFAERDKLADLVGDIRGELQRLAQSFRIGNSIRDGIPVVIAGPPNAGKSSLLNALCGEDRAIVTQKAGTTRDAIDIKFALGTFQFRFWDTAGLRDAEDTIESIGIKKSKDLISQCAIIILVCDQRTVTETDLKRLIGDIRAFNKASEIIIAANKCDLGKPRRWLVEQSDCRISCTKRQGLDVLQSLLSSWPERHGYDPTLLMVTGARHYRAIQRAEQALKTVAVGLTEHRGGELLAQDIRIALDEIGSITGEVHNDELLGTIFSRFCIGK